MSHAYMWQFLSDSYWEIIFVDYLDILSTLYIVAQPKNYKELSSCFNLKDVHNFKWFIDIENPIL